jgi:hypothetical protein
VTVSQLARITSNSYRSCRRLKFRLRVPDGKVVDIDDQTSKEVAPGVNVMCGTRGQLTLARVAIDADRSMKISREQVGKTAPMTETRTKRTGR